MAEEAVLGFLETQEQISDSHEFAASIGVSHTELENVIKSLKGFKIVDAQEIVHESWVLTEEGQTYMTNGSPEALFFSEIPPEGISRNKLKKELGPAIFDIGSKAAAKNKWISFEKDLVIRKVESVQDEVKNLLARINSGGEADGDQAINDLRRRKLIVKQKWKGYSLRKGPKYVSKRKKAVTDLIREHIVSGDWKNLEFKLYNLNAKAAPIQAGYVHSLMEVCKEVQNIFLQMGFEEMLSNKFVESCFWNYEALFQPQQHPARDSHDTFYLNAPESSNEFPQDYLKRVKLVHESGGYGSKGYGYEWKIEEAEKNLLRTHTTAVSARMLYALAQQEIFTPKRYYSIDRVFRNEAVDRTHLAEFHQIEGLICDIGLTLGDLIGVLEDFFSRLGMSKLRFKPAYNPYTEPSMEIFSYHEGLGKWVEVGNSGMFRPEMLLSMGLPEDVNVIAWGLSLERPTMILYGINNIRDLFGPKVDFNLIKNNPICRLGL